MWVCNMLARVCPSFSSLAIVSQFGLSGILKWTSPVRLHLLGLEVGTGTKVARCEIYNLGLGLWLLHWLRCSSWLLIQSGHLLSFAHLQHLIFGRAHLKVSKILISTQDVLTSKTWSSLSSAWVALAVWNSWISVLTSWIYVRTYCMTYRCSSSCSSGSE